MRRILPPAAFSALRMLPMIVASRSALVGLRGLKCYLSTARIKEMAPSLLHLRQLCTTRSPSSSSTQPTQLNEAAFHEIADHTLDELSELAGHLEESVDDMDLSMSQGVLTLALGQPYSKSWVINKQTPNRQ
ncbi:hypothetical protein EON65_50925, partial [archaeon]